MVMFDVNNNIRNIDVETRVKIHEAVSSTYRRMMPNKNSLDFLVQLFIENVDPNFQISCNKCKTRVINFWKQRLEIWKML